MPRGVAYLYTTASEEEIFINIERIFRLNGISLEYPDTNKVQLWDEEGEMIQIEKEELVKILPKISDYLIQFWWADKQEISMKIHSEDHLSEVCLYLDGLEDLHLKDVLYSLVNMIFESNIGSKVQGFVVDREEQTIDYDWHLFFTDEKILIDSLENSLDLEVYERKILSKSLEFTSEGFSKDVVFVAKRKEESDEFTICLLN